MSPTEFFFLLAIAVFVPFVLRYYRTGTGMYSFLSIDVEFRAYRRGKFVGSKVVVLYSDKRIDRFAPGGFKEIRGPAVAIYICQDEKSGQNWLWRLYRPTEPDPYFQKLTPHEVEVILERKEKLLKEQCPPQRWRPAAQSPPGKPGNRNHWD